MNLDIPINIIGIPLDDVLEYIDIKRYNTNNIWEEDGRPEDYDKVLAQTRTEEWVHIFHEVPESHILTILEEDLQWMRKAEQIGIITNEFSKLYEDELDDFCERVERNRNDFITELNKGGWFVRTSRVSLKCGIYGTGPYSNLKQNVQSMVW